MCNYRNPATFIWVLYKNAAVHNHPSMGLYTISMITPRKNMSNSRGSKMFEFYLLQRLYRFLNRAVRWALIMKRSEIKMIKTMNPSKHPPMIPIPRDDVRSSGALSLVLVREERFWTGTAPSCRAFSRWGLIMLETSSWVRSFRNSHLLTLGSSLSEENV